MTKKLLDFIAKYESGGNYNIVWGGIKKQHQPPRPLTQMTIGQVLAWQDSIDHLYLSEAAGKYQIMEDTLRDLYSQAGMTTNDLFDERGQDRLATQLLKRRGLLAYQRGEISAETFANRLAHEWASLPLVSGPKKGRSAYAEDGLNKSHVTVQEFMAAVLSVPRSVGTKPPPDYVPVVAKPSAWVNFIAALSAFFRRK